MAGPQGQTRDLIAQQLLEMLNRGDTTGGNRGGFVPAVPMERPEGTLLGLSREDWFRMAQAIWAGDPNDWLASLGQGLVAGYGGRDRRRQAQAALRDLWANAGGLGLTQQQVAVIQSLPPEEQMAALQKLIMQGGSQSVRYEPITGPNGEIYALVDPSSGKVIDPSDYMPDTPKGETRTRPNPANPGMEQLLERQPDGSWAVIDEYPSSAGVDLWKGGAGAGGGGAVTQDMLSDLYGSPRAGTGWTQVDEGAPGAQRGPDGNFYAVRPLDGERLTEQQSKDISFLRRGSASDSALADPAVVESLTSGEYLYDYAPLDFGRAFQSDEYLNARAIAEDFLAVVLRKDTGAAVTNTEFERYGRIFVPLPWETGPVLETKARARQVFLDSLRRGLGRLAALAEVTNATGLTTEITDEDRARLEYGDATDALLNGGVNGLDVSDDDLMEIMQ